MYGIQPMPPSESAILRSGNLWNTGDSSSSAVALIEFRPNSEIATVKLVVIASGEACGEPPEPKCSDSGTFASTAAANTGSQWSVCQDGRPMRSGSSGNVMDFAPLAAVRLISATVCSMFQYGTIISGIWRSG